MIATVCEYVVLEEANQRACGDAAVIVLEADFRS
jgi:hypothetical protein